MTKFRKQLQGCTKLMVGKFDDGEFLHLSEKRTPLKTNQYPLKNDGWFRCLDFLCEKNGCFSRVDIRSFSGGHSCS